MFIVQDVGEIMYVRQAPRLGLDNPRKISTLRVASLVPDAMVPPKGYWKVGRCRAVPNLRILLLQFSVCLAVVIAVGWQLEDL